MAFQINYTGADGADRALDTIVKEAARPVHRELAGIVQEILGAAATEKVVRLGTLSILGQAVYYLHARPIINRLYPEEKYSTEEIAEIADHISDFSILALKGLSGSNTNRGAHRDRTRKKRRSKNEPLDKSSPERFDLNAGVPTR